MEIREALEAAFEKDENPEQAASSEPSSGSPALPPDSVEPAPSDDASPSTESKPDEPESKPNESEPKPDEPKPAAPADATAPAKDHRVDRPPQSWRKEAKGEWGALPLPVRQEVYRRELEVNRVLRETGEARQAVEQFNQVLAPYMGRIQSFGIAPQQAIGELLKADMMLATGSRQQKAQLLAKLVSDYDVDVSELDTALAAAMKGSAPQAQPQALDPNYINQLVQQQLQQALAPMYQQQAEIQQRTQQDAVQSVEQMSLDPNYPYFEDVRQEMADLIEVASKRGVVLSLHDAYTKAVALDPAVSDQQSRQAQVTQANQQHLQAQRAKVASSSVTGAPASGGNQQFAGDGSLRSAIEAAFNNSRI